MPTGKTKVTQAAPVYELVNLEVHEVSTVDRPANLRKFLLLKSDTDEVGAPIVEKGDGTFTVATESEDAGKSSVESAGGADANAPTEDTSKSAPSDGTDNAGTGGDANASDSAADEVQAKSTTSEGQTAEQATPAEESDSGQTDNETPAEGVGKSDDSQAGDLPAVEQVELTISEETASMLTSEIQQKAGRKLSRRRAEKLREIVDQLASLLAEVTDTIARVKASEEAKREMADELETLKVRKGAFVKSAPKSNALAVADNATSHETDSNRGGRVEWPVPKVLR